jgi:hypothetical protein
MKLENKISVETRDERLMRSHSTEKNLDLIKGRRRKRVKTAEYYPNLFMVKLIFLRLINFHPKIRGLSLTE